MTDVIASSPQCTLQSGALHVAVVPLSNCNPQHVNHYNKPFLANNVRSHDFQLPP